MPLVGGTNSFKHRLKKLLYITDNNFFLISFELLMVLKYFLFRHITEETYKQFIFQESYELYFLLTSDNQLKEIRELNALNPLQSFASSVTSLPLYAID